MPDLYERLRAALPKAKFFPPATEQQIARVESKLGTRFPEWLRELFLKCDGIKSEKHRDSYLMALEPNDDFRESIISWNEFCRSEWLNYVDELKRNRPEIPWDQFGPHQLLVIGMHNAVEWVVDPRSGLKIIWHDPRHPDSWEVIASDLVEACIKNEEQEREAEEQLFRGRERYRMEHNAPPPARDIDHLLDLLARLRRPDYKVEDQKVSMGWFLRRATSSRSGEKGELYVLNLGFRDEIRFASRDGDFPLIMRLSAWPLQEQLSCISRSMRDALMRVLITEDLLSLPYIDGEPQHPDEAKLRQIWQSRAMPDPELSDIAEILFTRDNNRRYEKNKLG